jgi:hypothetical protein
MRRGIRVVAVAIPFFAAAWISTAPAADDAAVSDFERAGVKARLENYQGPATLSVDLQEEHRLQIRFDPQTETKPVTLRVELPISGRNAWPVADVEVLDPNGRAASVRRSGIEWHKLLISLPPVAGTYCVQAVDPPGDPPKLPSEEERRATHPATGLGASIATWYDGRPAALSIRFDDSHPTHLSKAIPILREYGFRGTFMVNPGGHIPGSRRRSAFEDHRAEWEACARLGDQEFANHSMHHQGAADDEAMETEIAEASKAIWKLFPERSKLVALNLGGGTQWETTRTLRYYLDKYHLFDASANSTGMDDIYGNRVATFRRLLEQHIQRGLWFKVHCHDVGPGAAASEANFRAALDIAKQHESDLWIAGMADIYKYQTERRGAKLAFEDRNPRQATLVVSCSTDPILFDQPLTIDLTLPDAWLPEELTVRNRASAAIPIRQGPGPGVTMVRFDVPPMTETYTIEKVN